MMEIALQFTELDENQLRVFDDILLRVGWKLVATWSHLDRYKKTEDHLVTAANEAGPINNQELQQLEYSQDLFLEIDEFLVQLKSTLDHLANIPFAMFGKSWQPRKFGSKGKNIAEALLGNLPQGNEERAKSMKEMLIDRYQSWLTDIIDKRNATNHFMGKSFNMDGLMVFRQVIDGEEKLHVPMWTKNLRSAKCSKPLGLIS